MTGGALGVVRPPARASWHRGARGAPGAVPPPVPAPAVPAPPVPAPAGGALRPGPGSAP
ncbi:cell division protein FtsL, partial [Streptomyces jumonjinensis]|nr:cell division protein FtsL [Streptomyces jumonjinensis]